MTKDEAQRRRRIFYEAVMMITGGRFNNSRLLDNKILTAGFG
ncbi:MAG: hypothetical protein AABY87_02840 [bacterium]